jgi:transketolase
MTLAIVSSPIRYPDIGLDIAIDQELEQRCVNIMRGLAIDAVQKAKSGHPGMPLGVADVAYVLWTRFLKHSPQNPAWHDRDRFILSAGHGSMLLYSLLHVTGYDLSLDDIKQFRQLGSRTPGHPEYRLTPGIETTTGPLGQGITNAVGMAMAERFLAVRFNRPDFPIVDHYTYVIASDGDLMEGISYEAASIAGHLKLGKLIVLYDSNGISIDGATDQTFTEDVAQRFVAAGWHVQDVDGHARDEIEQAIEQARLETMQPSIIICRTHIGFGSPNRQDTAKSHGEPLGEEEVRLTKQSLGLPQDETFYVTEEMYAHMRHTTEPGIQQERDWQQMMARYREVHPDLARLWDDMHEQPLSLDWDALVPAFEPSAKGTATRAASGQMINALAPVLPGLIGGSADMHGSNSTFIKSSTPLQADNFIGRNIFYGVREHAMGAIMNGLALHGGLLPFAGTFLIFCNYMQPSLRMAALMSLQVVYIFTHDSVGVGEDGPTHQPIEQIPTLRLIPNLHVVRPADATETALAWRIALERRDGPTALIFTRQAVPVLMRESEEYGQYGYLTPADGVLRGGYVLYSAPDPELILIATGSEVHLALDSARALEEQGVKVRVVSMPCWELFDQQEQSYRDEVLPPHIAARVSIEATVSFGWERYVGVHGRSIGINTFGVSAPGSEVFKYFGFTTERVVEVALDVLHANR